MNLDHKKMLTFDVVGTLIDFEAGIIGYWQNDAGCEADAETILATLKRKSNRNHKATRRPAPVC